MTKSRYYLLALCAGILPWLLFSDAVHKPVLDLINKIDLLLSKDLTPALIDRTKKQMVFISGGSFMFGKFDGQYGDQKYAGFYDLGDDVKKVNIDSFSLSKYQVTYADYDAYSQANKLPSIDVIDPKQKEEKSDNIPVQLTWQEATDYCQWLGKVIGAPVALPKETQWEYAARSKGLFILYPTDTGIVELGKNVPLKKDKQPSGDSMFRMKLMPIGSFPPNSIGIYDLASNGWEWMYLNPEHTSKTEDRYVRSYPIEKDGGAPTVYRGAIVITDRVTARCAVNQNKPLEDK